MFCVLRVFESGDKEIVLERDSQASIFGIRLRNSQPNSAEKFSPSYINFLLQQVITGISGILAD